MKLKSIIFNHPYKEFSIVVNIADELAITNENRIIYKSDIANAISSEINENPRILVEDIDLVDFGQNQIIDSNLIRSWIDFTKNLSYTHINNIRYGIFEMNYNDKQYNLLINEEILLYAISDRLILEGTWPTISIDELKQGEDFIKENPNHPFVLATKELLAAGAEIELVSKASNSD